MKENKQEYINYVKSIYPEMIEDFWYRHGELHFYMNEAHEETLEPYACIKRKGNFQILKKF